MSLKISQIESSEKRWYLRTELVVSGFDEAALRTAINSGMLVATRMGMEFAIRGDRLCAWLDAGAPTGAAPAAPRKR